MSKSVVICVDFDGTIVEHEYPEIGPPAFKSFYWLKEFQRVGVKLVLYTMRDGGELEEAIDFCRQKGIEFWAINDNPEQSSWTNSRKIYCQVFIDDNAIGCPLVETYCGRPVVDWDVVGPMVMKVLTEKYGLE